VGVGEEKRSEWVDFLEGKMFLTYVCCSQCNTVIRGYFSERLNSRIKY
jgi:hypothetical protein